MFLLLSKCFDRQCTDENRASNRRAFSCATSTVLNFMPANICLWQSNSTFEHFFMQYCLMLQLRTFTAL